MADWYHGLAGAIGLAVGIGAGYYLWEYDADRIKLKTPTGNVYFSQEVEGDISRLVRLTSIRQGRWSKFQDQSVANFLDAVDANNNGVVEVAEAKPWYEKLKEENVTTQKRKYGLEPPQVPPDTPVPATPSATASSPD